MKLNVKCANGKTLPFDVETSQTVAEFKEMIAAEAEVPAVQQARTIDGHM